MDQDFATEEAKYKVCVFPSVHPLFSQVRRKVCADSMTASRFEKECGILQKDGKAYLDSMRGALSSLLRPPLHGPCAAVR